MTALGLCVNAKSAMPDRVELAALGLTNSWLRTICYDLDSLDAALQTIDPLTRVCVILNSETQGYEDWPGLCTAFANRFRGRVAAVEILNEADLLNVPVATAARLTITAAPILRAAGMKVILSSVAGPNWPSYLETLASRTIGNADYANLHGYGQRIAGFPTNWGFGELADAIATAHRLSGLPVALTEQGIKIGDAGGEQGQAEYVRRLARLLAATPAVICPFACYFAWRDDIGGPQERGDQAFGLRKETGARRPAWQAFAEAMKEPVIVTPPPTPRFTVGAGIAARMKQYGTEPRTREMYHPSPEDWDYADAYGKDGRHYVYLKAERQILVTDPTTWVSEDELLNPKPPAPGALGWFTAQQIADTLGVPFWVVQSNWPLIADALDEQGIGDKATTIAALATIKVEVGSFQPINEFGDAAYFETNYGPGTPAGIQLGNVNPGDGARFHGRGYVQLTGRSNYRRYGQRLGIDLEGNPDLALGPATAARILALYFADHGIQALANKPDWLEVRKAVNGGTNGWQIFANTVDALVAL